MPGMGGKGGGLPMPMQDVPRTIRALMSVAMNIMDMQGSGSMSNEDGDTSEEDSHSHEDGEESASHMMDDY